MFNKVIFAGNLTRDPELRYSTQGNAICNFGIAVNSRTKQNNEQKEEVLFINVVVFGKQAEPCSQYLTKGRPVLVEGRLREHRWEKDGQQHSKMEVLAQSVRFLGGGKQGQGQGHGQQTAGATAGSDFADGAPYSDDAGIDEPF